MGNENVERMYRRPSDARARSPSRPVRNLICDRDGWAMAFSNRWTVSGDHERNQFRGKKTEHSFSEFCAFLLFSRWEQPGVRGHERIQLHSDMMQIICIPARHPKSFAQKNFSFFRSVMKLFDQCESFGVRPRVCRRRAVNTVENEASGGSTSGSTQITNRTWPLRFICIILNALKRGTKWRK